MKTITVLLTTTRRYDALGRCQACMAHILPHNQT